MLLLPVCSASALRLTIHSARPVGTLYPLPLVCPLPCCVLTLLISNPLAPTGDVIELVYVVCEDGRCSTNQRTYSFLSATIGLMREALRAGRYPASAATAPSRIAIAKNVAGSVGFVPNNNDAMRFATASDTTAP